MRCRPGRSAPGAALLAIAAALVATRCGSDTAELQIRPQGPVGFLPFRAHDVIAGYSLEVTVVVRETRGVAVALELISVGAVDLGTRQAYLSDVRQGADLRELGLDSVPGGSALSFDPALGLVADPPRGPVELTLAVRGTDQNGHPVSDFQVLTVDAEPARQP